MKLVRINHERCLEASGHTYVLAPDHWDEKEVKLQVRAARTAYLHQFEKAKENRPAPPYPAYPQLHSMDPDERIGDVQATYQAKLAAYKAWQNERWAIQKPFEKFLEDVGFLSLHSDDAVVFEVECDWAHRHGQALKYGNDDEVDGMPTPGALAGLEPEEQW